MGKAGHPVLRERYEGGGVVMTDEERQSLVTLRLQNARITLAEIPVHIEHGFYNTAVSRMYYACYYAVVAILLQRGVSVKTHSGVRNAFSKEFVLTGLVDRELSRFYSNLYANRQSGDYDDFIMMDEDIANELYPQAIHFIDTLALLIQEAR